MWKRCNSTLHLVSIGQVKKKKKEKILTMIKKKRNKKKIKWNNINKKWKNINLCLRVELYYSNKYRTNPISYISTVITLNFAIYMHVLKTTYFTSPLFTFLLHSLKKLLLLFYCLTLLYLAFYHMRYNIIDGKRND